MWPGEEEQETTVGKEINIKGNIKLSLLKNYEPPGKPS
jgi:hypothetical protein